MDQITIDKCPYCSSENIEVESSEWAKNNGTPYHCKDCDCYFDEEEVVREDLRRKISCILMDTDEDNQMKCDITIEPEDTSGLGSALWPTIDRCYQIPGEGTIWFHIEGHIDPRNWEDVYINFDDIDTKDLQYIYEQLFTQQRANEQL